ncbi:MAG TPA: ABC transporter permease [Bryobacteraceae bacterium]|nr:ABC transporter permease [Bryobacteraceae bacterium]
MGNLLLDVRYALRVLRKSPAFTSVALLSLMLGIGANVVVLGVMNAILLRPLDVSDPQSLYQIRHRQWMIGRLLTTSYPAFEDFRQRNVTFSGMAAVYGYSRASLRWRNAVRDVAGDEVSGNYFDLLGVRPQIGRFFHGADEHGPGSAPYVVLSDAVWRTAFEADPSIVGTTVELNDHPFTVLGVTPAQFHGLERFVWPDYWIPIVNQGQADGRDFLQSRTSVAVTVIGRLKPGVTPQQATENLNTIAAAIAREYPESDDGEPLRLIHPGLFGDEGDVIRGFIYGVTALAMLVLTAACANLASLFAARVADRSRELALRVALGSSRRQLLRQLLIEAILLSLAGGAAGLATADALLRVLSHWQPAAEAHLAANVDGRVFLAGMALTLGSALLFGIIPARQAWHSAPLQMMKSGPAGGTSLRRFAVRDLLLGVQVAVCTLLVVASLVAVRGMQRALHAPLGFRPQGATLASLGLKRIGWANDVAIEKQKAMIEAVRSIPGVTAVGTINRTPFTGGLHDIPIFRPGTVEFRLKNSALAAYVYQISPGYLNAAGTRLLNGRDVSWHDTAHTPHVAIVNEAFARKMWGEAPAIGQRFLVSGNLTEVVGVAENGKYHDLEESPHPAAYLSLSQSGQGETIFVVRSRRTVSEIAADLEHTLGSIAPNSSIAVQSWTDAVDSELLPARAATVSLGVMGLLAAMLAVTGIFGMAAYSVSRRMKELGIRVALGAKGGQVFTAALGRPMALLGAGSLVGLTAGFFASRLLGQIVYQANPSDPAVVVGTVLTMALLGLVASAIPARRALTADPSKLLREE